MRYVVAKKDADGELLFLVGRSVYTAAPLEGKTYKSFELAHAACHGKRDHFVFDLRAREEISEALAILLGIHNEKVQTGFTRHVATSKLKSSAEAVKRQLPAPEKG